jgi:hypothetical protein
VLRCCDTAFNLLLLSYDHGSEQLSQSCLNQFSSLHAMMLCMIIAITNLIKTAFKRQRSAQAVKTHSSPAGSCCVTVYEQGSLSVEGYHHHPPNHLWELLPEYCDHLGSRPSCFEKRVPTLLIALECMNSDALLLFVLSPGLLRLSSIR